MRRFAAVSLFLLLTLTFSGCGGSGSNNNPTSGGGLFTVTPATATVGLGSSTTFSTSNGQVASWSVNSVPGGNATVGTISNTGIYTAPAAIPSPNTVTVSASEGGSGSANAMVTVVYPNNNHNAQGFPVKLGTSGGNATDISGRNCCSGTLGALVNRAGTLYILSANHVLAKSDAASLGDPISQPGLIDNNCSQGATVATLTQFAPMKPASSPGPAPSNVDAAIARIVPGTVDPSGSILDLGAASSTGIASAPPSATLADPAAVLGANEGVAKSGRTTGLTCSNLQSISATVVVDYAQTCGGATTFSATFNNQITIAGGSFTISGDSGSLLVTSDTARPVGLIFAGSNTNSTANPIQQVLNALQSGGAVPAIVGGGDHAVSCQPTATAQSASATGAMSGTLSVQQRQRASDVRDRYADSLLQDSAVASVDVGVSADAPNQAALVITVRGATATPIPHALDGVRTRIINPEWQNTLPALTSDQMNNSIGVKNAIANALMARDGIIGVGVGRSDDNPAETALVIYVEQGLTHPPIPADISGVRTKLIETERFRAGGWSAKTQVKACEKPKRVVASACSVPKKKVAQ